MKALVTGGAGLIGSHVVDLLLKKGHEVKILDNLDTMVHSGEKPKWIPEDVEFIQGDVINERDLKKAMQGVNIVFHQAAAGGFMPGIAKYFHVNVVGTALIMEMVTTNKYPVEKVIIASSQAIYGEGKYECPEHGTIYPEQRAMEQLANREWELHCPLCGQKMSPLPTDESHVNPLTSYAMSKYTEESLALKTGRMHDIPVVALRYSVTYGPRQSITNAYSGICSIFSTRILNGLPLTIYEDGNQTRDFVYVGDVARANVLVGQEDKANFRSFNVGTSIRTSIMDFAQLLGDTYGRESFLETEGKFRPGDVRHLFADNSMIRQLGWEPKVSLTEGLNLYKEWIETQGTIKDYFSEASKIMKRFKVVQDCQEKI